MKNLNFNTIVNGFLLIAVLVFVGGAANYFGKDGAKKTTETTGEAAVFLQERQQAIEEAKKNGQKDYSYTSGFNPGIGAQ